jgi:hypothetical protein
MKLYTSLGITIGILAGIWTQLSTMLGLYTWVAFIAWACFFAAGGGRTGFLKTIPSNLSGLVWGWLIVWGAGAVGGWTGALAVAVAIGAFMMCIQANWSVLTFIPGAFAGTAVFFGTGGDWSGAGIALIAGAVLALLSGWTGNLLAAALTKQPAASAIAAEGPEQSTSDRVTT